MFGKKIARWFLIMDGTQAYIYTKQAQDHHYTLVHTLKPPPLNIDVSEGRKDLGRTYDSAGKGRHIIEPHTSIRTLERKQFARKVATFLDISLERGQYYQLILIASPKILGFLRAKLTKSVQEVIVKEIDKNLIPLGVTELEQQLNDILAVQNE